MYLEAGAGLDLSVLREQSERLDAGLLSAPRARDLHTAVERGKDELDGERVEAGHERLDHLGRGIDYLAVLVGIHGDDLGLELRQQVRLEARAQPQAELVDGE